jgi:transposase
MASEHEFLNVVWVTRRDRNESQRNVSNAYLDKAAVHAALATPWSNGQTEGQITKLKLVKRQMYGRAKLDLLRARLVQAA